MSVQKLFSIALGTTLLLCFAVVATIFSRDAVQRAESDTTREARVILAAAIAARSYSANHVTPLIQKDGEFHREEVPAFAVHKIMDSFSVAFPEYTYTEKVLNPTNLDNLARSWEIDVIQAFRSQPELAELSGEHEENGKRLRYLAEPIRIPNEGCLRCHGEPGKAPPAMIAAYGPATGFGWRVHEVVGARFVTAPFYQRLGTDLTRLFYFLIALGSVLIVILVVAMLMVHRAVASQAERLVGQAERLSTGAVDAAELEEQGPTEFRRLAAAINRLHRSLRLAMSELRESAD